MNYDQIRMFLMMVLLFVFGFMYSCNHAQAVESAGTPQTVKINTSPEVKQAIKDLGVLCITGQVVVVNPKSGDVLQIWKPYKQPDGSYVALPSMCGLGKDGKAEAR